MNKTNKPALFSFIIFVISQCTLVFLRLNNNINWSWLWVFAPMWGLYLLFMLYAAIIITYFVVSDMKERISNKHGRRISDNKKSR